MVPMCRAEPTKDPTLTMLQLYEEMKGKEDVYYKDLEKENLSNSQAAKSQEVPKPLAPNRGMGRSIKHKVKKEAMETCERPGTRPRAHRGGQAHSTAWVQQQNSLQRCGWCLKEQGTRGELW